MSRPADAHAEALSALEDWAPPHDAQARLRDEYVAHLRRRPDGLLRSCTPDHLTAGAIVLLTRPGVGPAQPPPQGPSLVRLRWSPRA
ncbi:MAG: hypothetical protein QM747_12205 [Nocardioides sp.]